MAILGFRPPLKRPLTAMARRPREPSGIGRARRPTDLERALAEIHGVEDCIAFVSGHATNVTVIGHLFGPKDLILHDALIHNSVVQGRSCRARAVAASRTMISTRRSAYWRSSGRGIAMRLWSSKAITAWMATCPICPALSPWRAATMPRIMVDEAHALGSWVRGVWPCRTFRRRSTAVDFWMGTLSKTLAGCGGISPQVASLWNISNSRRRALSIPSASPLRSPRPRSPLSSNAGRA